MFEERNLWLGLGSRAVPLEAWVTSEVSWLRARQRRSSSHHPHPSGQLRSPAPCGDKGGAAASRAESRSQAGTACSSHIRAVVKQ